MIQSQPKRDKPILYDPLIITRVKQYLEENVHQTYVDVSVMAKKLQERYREYSRRKSGPFRVLVEQAYKTVLHSYGLDSNPSSDDNAGPGGNSDLEVMDDNSNSNHMNDMLTNLYSKNSKKDKSVPANENEAIDISSDESGDDGANGKTKKRTNNNIPDNDGKKSILYSFCANEMVQPHKKRKVMHQPEVPKMPPLTNAIHHLSGGDAGFLLPGGARAKRYKKEILVKQAQCTFRDIGGMDRVLKELCELLYHVKRPEIYLEIGLSPPRGFLLHGPPGCGKTLLAQAIAGQLSIGFIEVPATELIAGVSGESEERIREVFEQALCCAPCVLFIDEIDAISSNRQNAQKDMERRVVAQLISSLDGLSRHENGDQIVVVGATNRPEVLDPALRRVGRFDHEIALGVPDRKEREEILIVISETLTLQHPFDYRKVAELTPGYVGADLMALATRAASIAVKRKYFNQLNRFRATKLRKNILIVDLLEETATENEGKEKGSSDDIEQAPKKGEESNKDKQSDIEKETTDKTDKTDEPKTPSKEKEVSSSATSDSEKMDIDATDKTPAKDSKVATPDKNSTVDSTKISPQKNTDKNGKINDDAKKDEPIDVDELSDDEQPVELRKDPSLSELLAWLNADTPHQDLQLADLYVTLDDFKEAIKLVKPSAKREGFITVPDVTWDDIGSLHNIREELQLAILAPVKYPERLNALGLNAPSGVLLCGPPGCGKTLLAKAIANEAGINFISVKGPELMNMYVGESERAVRQCFQRARNSAPCVIFFDEFDSLCPKRSESGEAGAGTRVVNQLLTEMDGIEDRKGVFLMAATNRPDIIDPAVLRPGRLDTVLYVGLPETRDREEILDAITKKGCQPVLDDDVDLHAISEMTDGFTGADLSGLVRQASFLALKESMSETHVNVEELKVTQEYLLQALKLTKPSVSEEDREEYEQLRDKFAAPRAAPKENEIIS